jgi:hypothetical protein
MSDLGVAKGSPTSIEAGADSRVVVGFGEGPSMSTRTISPCLPSGAQRPQRAGSDVYALRTMTKPQRAAHNRHSPLGARHCASH